MILSIEHDLLVTGPDLETCCRRVQSFFAKSQLVRYDVVDIDRERSVRGSDPRFEEYLNRAIAANHEVLSGLHDTLKEEGYESLEDLLRLPQGFESKLLHTMCHLLDGFFGVDSHFFDIDEVSSWLTENRRTQLGEDPESCWLVHARAKSFYGGGFEKKST
jgi:hypothetical protein